MFVLGSKARTNIVCILQLLDLERATVVRALNLWASKSEPRGHFFNTFACTSAK